MPMMKKYPRRARRGAKKAATKQRRRARKQNKDTHFERVTTSFLVTPQQGVTTTNYMYAYVSLLATGSTGSSITDNTQFQFLRKMYDRVRVNRVKVSWVPKANVLSLDQAQNDALLNASGDGMIHTAIDRDGSVPVAKSAFLNYPSYKPFSILKKWSRSYATTYPKSIWLDADDFLSADTQTNRAIGLYGGVSLYAENILEDSGELINEPLGTMTVEWDCVFQGRSLRSISVDTVNDTVTLSNYVDKEAPYAAGMIVRQT